MTRAAEFCYVAENAGRFMLATTENRVWWTDHPEMALRFTQAGCQVMAERAGRSPHHHITFRRLLPPGPGLHL